MSWVASKASLSRVALAALLAAGAASAAADVIVVRSSGPSAKSYPPGRSLPDSARIVLRPGDSLVVLDRSGTRAFRGPGSFSPGGAVQAQTRSADSSSGRRARIGAVRTAGLDPQGPTTIWHIDVTQSGTICLANTSDVMLWRPDSAAAAAVTITAPGGESQSLQWPAGQATIAWPTALGIAHNGEYRFRQAGVAVPTTIRFKLLASEPADLQAVAAALIENECQEQLDLLVETAPGQDAPTG